jgi:hypothetical protein
MDVETFMGNREGTGPYRMPPAIHRGIEQYIEHGYQPGSFLTAVLNNDLTQAIGQADENSTACLVDIVKYLYNEAPGPCWGTPERVKAWIAAKAAERAEREHRNVARE